jgi:hypothetical protein
VRECQVCDTDISCTFLASPRDMHLRIVRLFFIFFLLLCEKAFSFIIVLSLLRQCVMLRSYSTGLMPPASHVHLGFKEMFVDRHETFKRFIKRHCGASVMVSVCMGLST